MIDNFFSYRSGNFLGSLKLLETLSQRPGSAMADIGAVLQAGLNMEQQAAAKKKQKQVNSKICQLLHHA